MNQRPNSPLNPHHRRARVSGAGRRLLLAGCLALGLTLLGGLLAGNLAGDLAPGVAHAQDEGGYVVQPGDTLAQIAAQFGITVEELAAANGLEDVNLIRVGQRLIIPGQETSLPQVAALPGDTLPRIGSRYQVSPTQLAALNGLAVAQRLFPGQPIRLPETAQPIQRLSFGAVLDVALPDHLVQGHTGELAVTTSRPLSLTGVWNGLPLALAPLDDPLRQFAHLPAPALLGPGRFDLALSYTARDGRTVTRTFPVEVVEGEYIRQEINLPPGKGGLLDAEKIRAELERLQAIWGQSDTPIQWREPFTRPIGSQYPTTSPYGTRRSYNGGPYNTYHSGEDIAAPKGVTVTAPGDGIVVLAEPLFVRGNAVILDHGRGVFTGYWHMDKLLVEAGQAVKVGQPLGLVGTTGLSTGDHLHWELRVYGISVDPMQFLDEPLFPPPPEELAVTQ